MDPVAYPAEQLAALYFRRWRIELEFRDLKTTLGRESLRCTSPGRGAQELEMGLIASTKTTPCSTILATATKKSLIEHAIAKIEALSKRHSALSPTRYPGGRGPGGEF